MEETPLAADGNIVPDLPVQPPTFAEQLSFLSMKNEVPDGDS